MQFYRRDLVLLAASVLFTMAAALYMGVYAFGVGLALFFGMKMIAVRRQQAVDKAVGEGICAECGQPIAGGRCAECDPAGGRGEGEGAAEGEGAGGRGGEAPAEPEPEPAGAEGEGAEGEGAGPGDRGRPRPPAAADGADPGPGRV